MNPMGLNCGNRSNLPPAGLCPMRYPQVRRRCAARCAGACAGAVAAGLGIVATLAANIAHGLAVRLVKLAAERADD